MIDTRVYTVHIRPLMANATARRDPTRSAVLRQRYEREIRRRYGRVSTAVRDLFIAQDALGLTDGRRRGVFQEYPLDDGAGILGAFDVWLLAQMAEAFGGRWQDAYVREAYARGLLLANAAAVREGVPLDDPDNVDPLLLIPPYNGRYQLHTAQQQANLKQNTDNTRNNMVVALGALLLTAGISRAAVNRQLQGELRKFGIVRGQAMARTGVVGVLNDGILDRLEALNFKRVTPMVEVVTAGDDMVCQRCASIAIDGRVYTIAEARGVIPVHTSCRCSWLPVLA